MLLFLYSLVNLVEPGSVHDVSRQNESATRYLRVQ